MYIVFDNTKKCMDFTELKWTKNVNHKGDDKYWAYQHIDPDLNIFRLNWKTEQAENALKPKEGELILLISKACFKSA